MKISLSNRFNPIILAGALFAAQEAQAANEIIIDNSDAQAIKVGDWKVSGLSGSHGADSIYTEKQGDRIEWRPDITASEDYSIEAWFVPYANRDNTAVFKVHHANGNVDVIMNQTDSTLGNQWNELGTYTLNPGSYVSLSHDGSGIIGADALKFIPMNNEVIVDNSGSQATIVDNSDAQAIKVGDWKVSGLSGSHGADSIYTETQGDRIEWRPDITASGDYSIEAWFVPYANRDNTAAFKIHHANGNVDVIMDQTNSALGNQWNELGTYTLNPGSYVSLSHDGSGIIGADALKFIPMNNEIIVDNSDAQATKVGDWKVSGLSGSHGADSIYTETQGDRIEWRPDITASGDYSIGAWWVPYANRDSSAVFSVHHANGTIEIVMDQTDPTLGNQWNEMGTYTLNPGSYVSLSHDGSGIIGADAIRFTQAIAVNQPPVLEDQYLTSYKNYPIDIYPLEGATDPEGDNFYVMTCDNNSYGTITFDDPNSRVIYTPDVGQIETDYINCFAMDEAGNTSSPSRIEIVINAISNQTEASYTGRYANYQLVDMGGGNVNVYDTVLGIDDNYSAVEKILFADGTYENGEFTQLKTGITYPKSTFPADYCGVYMTYGLELDDYLLNNDEWKNYLDKRIAGEKTTYPAKRLYYSKENIDNVNSNSVSFAVSDSYGTDNDKMGVMFSVLVPDNQGLCRSFDSTSNPVDERYKVEIPISGLYVHDGTREGYSQELIFEAVDYIQENYSAQFQVMMDLYTGTTNTASGDVDECAAQYPDDTVDTDGDNIYDFTECMMRTDPYTPN